MCRPRAKNTARSLASLELVRLRGYRPTAMNSMTRECLSVLLLSLLAGCEKDTIVPEKPAEGAAKTSAAATEGSAKAGPDPSAASSVGASEVTPDASAKANGGEKKCAPGGCAPGKCG